MVSRITPCLRICILQPTVQCVLIGTKLNDNLIEDFFLPQLLIKVIHKNLMRSQHVSSKLMKGLYKVTKFGLKLNIMVDLVISQQFQFVCSNNGDIFPGDRSSFALSNKSFTTKVTSVPFFPKVVSTTNYHGASSFFFPHFYSSIPLGLEAHSSKSFHHLCRFISPYKKLTKHNIHYTKI